jgi:NADH:ubiquinone oxidoreductase subunit 3 (subunit A)
MLLAQPHQHHPQQIGKMLITISEKTHLGYYGILESGNKSLAETKKKKKNFSYYFILLMGMTFDLHTYVMTPPKII